MDVAVNVEMVLAILLVGKLALALTETGMVMVQDPGVSPEAAGTDSEVMDKLLSPAVPLALPLHVPELGPVKVMLELPVVGKVSVKLTLEEKLDQLYTVTV